MPNITVDDFASLFGTTPEEITRYCGDILKARDFEYEEIAGEARDKLLLEVLERIFDTGLRRAGKERQGDWETGWRENLEEFVASNFDFDHLVPKYFKKNVPARLNLKYIMPLAPNFVFDYTHVYRTWLFRKYLERAQNIYEFGCGPAYHLVYLARLYPEKNLFGLDWATSSQEIIGVLSKELGFRITGRRFDFFEPASDLVLERDSAVFTFGALEQIGDKHGEFLNFLLRNKPAICMNVECLHEFYDPDNLLSFLALQYHRKRNYLSGYLTALRDFEKDGRIKIIASHYHKFGNMYDDALSYVVWRPI